MALTCAMHKKVDLLKTIYVRYDLVKVGYWSAPGRLWSLVGSENGGMKLPYFDFDLVSTRMW